MVQVPGGGVGARGGRGARVAFGVQLGARGVTVAFGGLQRRAQPRVLLLGVGELAGHLAVGGLGVGVSLPGVLLAALGRRGIVLGGLPDLLGAAGLLARLVGVGARLVLGVGGAVLGEGGAGLGLGGGSARDLRFGDLFRSAQDRWWAERR
ncbi:hypothetical protein [Actinomadura nitritigenes]|uniref:hypothetical protein n=1 Tax=Actinomadura nitritigenes TaxID=134602 RepID=UPI003D8D8415